MSLFDDMADLFTDPDSGFGEEISYTPVATGRAVTVNGVWITHPIIDGMAPGADVPEVTLGLRTADIAGPAEGDIVVRTATGERMIVVPPIKPDGYGMVTVALEVSHANN